MRSVFICTTLVAVVSSVFSQRPFARYSENLKKGIPHHYNHDKEDTNRGVDKIARGHKIEPPLPPLRSHQAVPWLRWVHEGRWAAQVDKNTELHKVRTRLLEEKLKPNHFVFKPRISPQLKPKLNRKENARTKREVGKTEIQEVQKETGEKGYIRHKRDAMMPQLMPEMIMQPHIEVKMPKPPEQFKERPEEMERRGKRQILYFINGPPRELARAQITTPNPFIRDTHIEDYDIIRSEVGEREGMIPTIESGSSDLGSHPLMKIPQLVFRFLQIAKTKIQQSYHAETETNHRPNSVKEEAHVRVKRRMSRFIRDRKQMTRKKKIGRAKKTKVKRTPVKVRKWYDKRQKVKKKGDGTYRGGRGRKPRQHKRPRHYKPPMNETSDYDYYDSKGGIRGEEEQEGPDVADYLSYVSGEYSDTEEAERANQEMEKEYQEQLKRKRIREHERKLSNHTVESPHKQKPLTESRESKKHSKKDSEREDEVKEESGKKESLKEEKIERKSEEVNRENEENEESLPKRKIGYTKRRMKHRESSEESTEESTSKGSKEESTVEESTEEESTKEESTEEGSTEEESTEEESTEERSSEERSSEEEDHTEDSTEEESSDKESSDEPSGGKKRRFPRKYRKSPRWKQGKIGKYESDPRKIKNKQGLMNKEDTKTIIDVKEQNKHKSSEKESHKETMLIKDNKNVINQQGKLKTATKSQASANVRKSARKFNFFSISSYPIIRNFMAIGEHYSANSQRNFVHPKDDDPPNRISSLRFETPHHIAIQRLQSMPLKKSPDAISLTNSNLVSSGGEHLQNLQSKRAESPIQSTSKDRKLSSIAHDKPKDTLTLLSESKNERKKWTSTGTDHMGSIQSLKVDPVVLTSIAKTAPELNIDKKAMKRAFMKVNNNTHVFNTENGFPDHPKKVNIHVHGSNSLPSTSQDKPQPSVDIKDKVFQQRVMEEKQLHENDFNVRKLHVEKDENRKIFKREVSPEEHKESSFEELSSIPESAGVSIPSGEIESASDDKK